MVFYKSKEIVDQLNSIPAVFLSFTGSGRVASCGLVGEQNSTKDYRKNVSGSNDMSVNLTNLGIIMSVAKNSR